MTLKLESELDILKMCLHAYNEVAIGQSIQSLLLVLNKRPKAFGEFDVGCTK